MQDYRNFADIISFQDRVDLHHVVLQNVAAGSYYIAVYNNDAYFKVRPYCVGQTRLYALARVSMRWSMVHAKVCVAACKYAQICWLFRPAADIDYSYSTCIYRCMCIALHKSTLMHKGDGLSAGDILV